MNKLLLLMLCGCPLLLSAQRVTVESNVELLKGVEGPSYYPVLNSSGDKLLFAGEDANGLKLYDMTDDVVTRISSEAGAGFDAKWGADGNVYYVTMERGADKLIYRTGHCYDVAKNVDRVVLEAQHGAMLPQVGTKGVILRGKSKKFESAANIGTSVYAKGSKVMVTVNGVEREFSPVESWAGYIWPSLSPDGTKVAFVAAEKGVVVMDLNGNVLSMLGRYEMPCWYNNDYLVAQNATDDGHQFTSSQIMLLKADGSFKYELTSPTSMSMQPTSAAGKIVYTSIDGILHLMTISIND